MNIQTLAELIIDHDPGSLANINLGNYQIEGVVDNIKRFFADPSKRSEDRPGAYADWARTVHQTAREELIEGYQLALTLWNGGTAETSNETR